MRKKDFSPYSTAHPRAFGFIILFFIDCINLIFQPEKNIFWQLNLHGNNYANSAYKSLQVIKRALFFSR